MYDQFIIEQWLIFQKCKSIGMVVKTYSIVMSIADRNNIELNNIAVISRDNTKYHNYARYQSRINCMN